MSSIKEINITDKSFLVQTVDQILKVEEWGNNTVRITCSPEYNLINNTTKGIEELDKNGVSKLFIEQNEQEVILINGDLKVVYEDNKLIFYKQNKKVLEEYSRKQSNVRRTVGINDHVPIQDIPSSSLNISPREFVYQCQKSYKAILRFEGANDERIYGLGGYQEKNLNKNFGTYELMQRNSQTSIPFYISNRNYGFIWNNASIGEVSFSKNQKIWRSNNTESIDYLITVGEGPRDIIENFMSMTGKSPMINNNLLGLWQSKLRYQTIDEIKSVYEGYVKRGINLSVLVIDYFHWTADGDFEFDMEYWQGIEEVAKELKGNGTELMVSLWPTVTKESKYYDFYNLNQMLIRSKSGKNNIFGEKEILDFSNPLTQDHMKKILTTNYRKKGVNLFWADQAEPEMSEYNHEEYLVYEGELEKVGNRYPYHYLKTVQEIKKGDNVYNPVLIRSAWFNSQKYGALAWSGDIESSFNSLQRQIQISISMGLTGIPWWTSDIAGFHSGDSNSHHFKELMIRWFQFAVFSPILRMHGDRQPHTQKIGESGGGVRTSGGPNEIWSFGKEVEDILIRYTKIRENLKGYIETIFEESTKYGYPIIRSLFFEFSEDEKAWEDTTNFMFGNSLLVAPITEENIKSVDVYLPKKNNWVEVFTGKKFIGGKTYSIDVSIDNIPVFCKENSKLEKEIDKIFMK